MIAPLRRLQPRISTLNTSVVRTLPRKTESVYSTQMWRDARTQALKRARYTCSALGCSRNRCRLFVDHIIELRDGGAPYEQSNLQVLCGEHHTLKTNAVRAVRHTQRR